jgi:hypothetical protein
MRFLITIISISILLGCQSREFTHQIKKQNSKLVGQTAPSDMVFIKGENGIPSFYISVCEEPNINYITYLYWLNTVYGADYPNIVKEAMPHDNYKKKINNSSDPYFTAYFTNPLYAYYPIVNLDFKQIQRYLAWKTDRLNEAILIKTKYLQFNTNQVNEASFNTESYLNGQYHYKSSHPDICSTTINDRILLGDGALFMGYRLPTESEWKHSNKNKFRNKKLKRETSLHSKKLNFGKGYFLKPWQSQFNSTRDTEFNSQSFGIRLKQYFFDLTFLENSKATIQKPDSGYISIMNYSSNSNGVINMEGGVKEVLLDTYAKFYNDDNWLNIMEKGNFKTKKVKQFDDEGYEIEKDSLGYMSYRYVGIDNNGNPIPVAYRNESININRLVIGGSYSHPNSKRDSLPDGNYSDKIGFRCVLPYNGAPVRKGHKVKW